MRLLKKMSYVLCLALISVSCSTFAEMNCTIKQQDGEGDGAWCMNHNQSGTIRCYAQVEYANGDQKKIFGDTCYSSFGDCWSSGKGSVEPRCAK